jgi:hypothetical protein
MYCACRLAPGIAKSSFVCRGPIMTLLGTLSLLLFLSALIAALRGWIPQRVLTLQSVLVLVALVIILLRVIVGPPVLWAQIFTATSLHPITSTIAGFLFAGALQAAGGFQAAASMVGRVTHTPLGLPFAIVLLVNFPTVFAMPCGRILAAPLMPLALMLGFEIARLHQDKTMTAMVVFGLLVNAGASCAPSLIGGLGLLGEGMGRFPMGAFSKPNQMGILAITIATMAVIRLYYGRTLSVRTEEAPSAPSGPIPETAYLSFILFIAVLIVVVAVRPPIPIQTILTLMTVVVMFVARLSFRDLLSGIILHPLSALVAGYIVAGALLTASGFEVLQALLVMIAEHTVLGYIGVSVLVVFLPLFLAMPCGRIISVSLIPGVLMFGGRVAEASGFALAPAVLLSSFVLSSAASCGPSPLGGVGNIGEGRLRLRGFWSSRPQSLGIFMGVPLAALLVPLHGIQPPAFDPAFALVMLLIGATVGVLTNILFGYRPWHLGGVIGGLLVGILTVIL